MIEERKVNKSDVDQIIEKHLDGLCDPRFNRIKNRDVDLCLDLFGSIQQNLYQMITNVEIERIQDRERRLRNSRRKSSKKYYQKNKETWGKYSSTYYQDNKEKLDDYYRDYHSHKVLKRKDRNYVPVLETV